MTAASDLLRAAGRALRSTLRILRWLLLLLLILMLWLLLTTSGLHASCALISHLTGQSLTIARSDGRLAGAFSLQGVRWQAGDGSQIGISKIEIHWHPLALLHARVHIENLLIDGLRVQLRASNHAAPSSTTPALRTAPPLGLVIDQAELRDLSLQEDDRKALKVAEATAAGDWINDRLRIRKLDTRLPETGPLHLEGEARLATQRIRIERLELKGPGTIDASGVVGIGAVPSALQLSWRQLRWPLVAQDGKPPQAVVDGNGELDGRLDDWNASLTTQGRAYEVPFDLSARGTGDHHGAKIASLELRTKAREPKGREGLLRLNGSLGWEPAMRADLDGSLANLDPGLFARDWNGNLNGRFSLQSVLRHQEPLVDFNIQLTPSTLRGQALQLAARGQIDADRLRLDTFELQAAQGRLTAQGEVRWKPQASGNLQLVMSRLNPGVFDRNWPGRLSGSMSLTGSTAADGSRQTVIRGELDHSQLRGHPVVLETQGLLRQPDPARCAGSPAGCSLQLSFDRLLLKSGTTTLDAHGAALPPFDLQGRFDSPDLAQFDARLQGRIGVQFTLQGPLATPHLITQGQALQLHYGQMRLGSLHWDVDVDPQQESHVKVTAADGEAGVHIERADLTARGLEVYHHARIDLVTADGTISADLQGGYDRKRLEWGGELASLTLAPAGLSSWSLEKGVGILIGRKRLSIEPACLTDQGGHLCLTLLRDVIDPGLQLHWNLAAVPLDGFQPLMPPHLDIGGRLDGEGQLHWLNGDLTDTHGQLTMTNGRLTSDHAGIQFDPSRLEINQESGRVRAIVDLRAPQGSLEADLSAATAARLSDRPLSGQVAVTIPDLAFLQPFLREMKAIGGHVGGSLGFGGTLAHPVISGGIALEQGHAVLTTPGIHISDASFHVRGEGTGPLAIDGELHSGGGTMKLAGTLDPSQSPPVADVHIEGKEFQAVALPEAHIWVSPDLHLTYDTDGLGLAGTLTVPKADLTPLGTGGGTSTVSVSRDQVLVGAPPSEQQKSLQLTASVSFVLGQQVKFSGYGLTTRIEGSVDVDEVPGYDTAGQGELRLVDGHYKAYGQNLTIERGRLIFDGGPITQPAVDISAYRQPQSDIRVGVRARGPIDRPLLSLYSDPTMPREQQLSWLLFGRPLDQNSSADRNMLSSAALSLGLSGGDFLMEQIGKRIGLDVISVGAAPAGGSEVATNASHISGSQASYGAGSTSTYTSQSAQLTLGKYLTPRIFVSYGIGLFQTGQTFRLLYDIGHGFKVQTETSTSGSGGDLLYTIDSGK